MSTNHIHNDSEGGIFTKTNCNFYLEFDEQQKIGIKNTHEDDFIIIILRIMKIADVNYVKTFNLLIEAYQKLMSKRKSYQFSTDELLSDNF